MVDIESSEEAVQKRVCGITSQKIRQMTLKYRQFASLIVLLCGPDPLFRGITSQKNSSNDAEIPTICLVNRSFSIALVWSFVH